MPPVLRAVAELRQVHPATAAAATAAAAAAPLLSWRPRFALASACCSASVAVRAFQRCNFKKLRPTDDDGDDDIDWRSSLSFGT